MNESDAESTSLSEHEQTYVSHDAPDTPAVPEPAAVAVPEPVAEPAGDEPEPQRRDESRDGERDEHGRFKPTRAKSQHATPADVEKINEYTKRLRAAEDAVGVKVEKQAGESERVYQLRRRAEIAEAIRDRKAQPPPAPVQRQPEPPKAFTEKEPQYEDFADQPDQYAAHLRAVAAYDRRKESFEARQNYSKETEHRAIEERNARRDQFFQELDRQHNERWFAYEKENPHAKAVLDALNESYVSARPWLSPEAKAAGYPVPEAVGRAIQSAPNSPQLLMRFAQDEALRDDLIDLVEGKPLNKDLVERVQRRLNRGLTDAATGPSPVPPKPVALVPRPPTPVRTGPMKPPDTPPGEDAPLSAHEAAYGGGPRRRR